MSSFQLLTRTHTDSKEAESSQRAQKQNGKRAEVQISWLWHCQMTGVAIFRTAVGSSFLHACIFLLYEEY